MRARLWRGMPEGASTELNPNCDHRTANQKSTTLLGSKKETQHTCRDHPADPRRQCSGPGQHHAKSRRRDQTDQQTGYVEPSKTLQVGAMFDAIGHSGYDESQTAHPSKLTSGSRQIRSEDPNQEHHCNAGQPIFEEVHRIHEISGCGRAGHIIDVGHDPFQGVANDEHHARQDSHTSRKWRASCPLFVAHLHVSEPVGNRIRRSVSRGFSTAVLLGNSSFSCCSSVRRRSAPYISRGKTRRENRPFDRPTLSEDGLAKRLGSKARCWPRPQTGQLAVSIFETARTEGRAPEGRGDGR